MSGHLAVDGRAMLSFPATDASPMEISASAAAAISQTSASSSASGGNLMSMPAPFPGGFAAAYPYNLAGSYAMYPPAQAPYPGYGYHVGSMGPMRMPSLYPGAQPPPGVGFPPCPPPEHAIPPSGRDFFLPEAKQETAPTGPPKLAPSRAPRESAAAEPAKTQSEAAGKGPAAGRRKRPRRRESARSRNEEKRERHNMCERRRAQRINDSIAALRDLLDARGELVARDKGSVLEQAATSIRVLGAFADAARAQLADRPGALEAVELHAAAARLAASEAATGGGDDDDDDDGGDGGGEASGEE